MTSMFWVLLACFGAMDLKSGSTGSCSTAISGDCTLADTPATCLPTDDVCDQSPRDSSPRECEEPQGEQVVFENEYTDILPEPFKLYAYFDENGSHVQFYISDKERSLGRMMALDHSVEDCVGYIHFALDRYEGVDNMTVLWLATNEYYKHRGIGTYLMLVASAFASSQGIRTIELDDESASQRDRRGVVNSARNIYRQLGLKYTYRPPLTDMEGFVDEVTSKWQKFVDKYTERGFFTRQ